VTTLQDFVMRPTPRGADSIEREGQGTNHGLVLHERQRLPSGQDSGPAFDQELWALRRGM